MKRFVSLWCLLLFACTAPGFEFRRFADTHEDAGIRVACLLEEPKASYAFWPPFNWDVTYDQWSHTVTLAPKKDPKSWITIRLAPATNSPGAGIRTYMQMAFPKAELVEQFTMRVASKDADAVDLTDPSAGVIPLKRRLVLLGSPSGIFEFLLSSRSDDFDSAERVFSQLLTSFEFRGPPANPTLEKPSPVEKPSTAQAR